MGHTPSAVRGRALITDGNADIMVVIQDQCDVAMAKQEDDRAAGARAIKKRHADEMKSFKRNHKHRTKRIKDQMKRYEDMDPIVFAETFQHYIDDNLFDMRRYWVLPDRMPLIDPEMLDQLMSKVVTGRLSGSVPMITMTRRPDDQSIRMG